MFRVTSKNCDPKLAEAWGDYAPASPYNATVIDATQYTGSGSLSASISTSFQSDTASGGASKPVSEKILQTVNSFSLLPCGNPVVPPSSIDPAGFMYQEAGSLLSPFFFKDTTDPSASNELTFFVQPSLTEDTREWSLWALAPPTPSDILAAQGAVLVAQVPLAGSGSVIQGDAAYSVFALQNNPDWVTSAVTAVSYRNTLIGETGAINAAGLSASTGGTAAATRVMAAGASGLLASKALAVIGNQGLSSEQLKTIMAAQSTKSLANVATQSRRRTS